MSDEDLTTSCYYQDTEGSTSTTFISSSSSSNHDNGYIGTVFSNDNDDAVTKNSYNYNYRPGYVNHDFVKDDSETAADDVTRTTATTNNNDKNIGDMNNDESTGEKGGFTSISMSEEEELTCQRLSQLYLQVSCKGLLSYYGNHDDFTPNGIYSSALDLRRESISTVIEPGLSQKARQSIINHDVFVPIQSDSASSASRLRLKIADQTFRSFVRNAGCYMLVACVLYLAISGHQLFLDLHTGVVDGRVAVLVCFALGLIAMPFQIFHILLDFQGKKPGPTVIAGMLRAPLTRSRFCEMVDHLNSAAPFIGAEVRRRPGPFHKLQTTGDMSTKKVGTVFLYDAWADISPPLRDSEWPEGVTGWVTLCKDYRLQGAETQRWFNEESLKFKDSVSFEKKTSHVSFRFVLDVQEGEKFFDAQTFLVVPEDGQSSWFYGLPFYKILLCLCLDFVYNVAFLVSTRRFPDQCIVKVIKRQEKVTTTRS